MEDTFRQFREQWANFDVKTLKNFLSQYDLETRKYIVNKKCPTEEVNALFYICGLKDESRLTIAEKVEIVKYFLDECGADVEITGKEVVHEDNNSVHIAPPLWVTAIRGNLPLAAVLLDHGADVNGRSNSQSAAVRTACYKNDEKMVEFLISKGADVNIPNRYGSSCLMNAVKCASLVKLLVEKGANVNARETKKMQLTALHYAIHNESFESFQFLLESGADPSIPDKYGDSPLRSAACFLQPEMADLLCQRPEISQNDVIECFELLGASAVDNEEYRDSEEYWLKAVKLRGMHGIQKEVKPTLPVLGPNLEHTNFEELQTVCDGSDRQRRESVIVKHRILGPLHEEFLYTLLQYGFNRPSNYETLQVFISAHDLFLERNKPLHENNIYSLRMIIRVAVSIAYQTPNDMKPLIIENIFCKFIHVVDQIQAIIRKGKHKTTSERSKCYNNLLFITIFFAKFLLVEEKESERFLTACRRLADVNPTFVSRCEPNLLHAVLDRRFFNENAKGFSTYTCDPLLDLDMVRLFLKSGFDVNYFDKERRTCLHRFLRQLGSRDTLDNQDCARSIVSFLLEHGVHVDTVDAAKENCLDLLRETGIMFDELRYRSLKCLAALVVGKYKIPHDGLIPFTLNPFVALHQPPE
ncbi:protein fem-1 homolog C-like [Saccostrea echinata]|uniref:protein fem-1 homolog C-like n=1 Tax=Saccostrea echinata TaxID=191078 RepID=UPI002A83C986|nr:protein fem-1 homolog C-like [Saccostrea echinata]